MTITDSNIVIGSPPSLLSHSYLLSDSITPDGSITLKLFDTKISHDNGINFHEVFSFGNNDSIKANIFLENDMLVLLVFKGSNRPSEFQQPHAFVREKDRESEKIKPVIRSVFYLPDGFNGYSWIALEQADGEVAEFDEEGRRVLRIPESGLLSTQAKPMPAALAKRDFAFFYEKTGNTPHEPINIIPENCFNLFQSQKLEEGQIKEHGFDPDQRYVLVFRYNNPGRDGINKLFGRDISGQVLWFRVDTLRNLLKSGDMLQGS